MARMLKTEYMKLQRCIKPLNATMRQLIGEYQKSFKNGESQTIFKVSDAEYDAFHFVTEPCRDIAQKREELHAIPIRINKSSDLTLADFSPVEQSTFNYCIGVAGLFNDWFNLVKELNNVSYDEEHKTYTIKTENNYLKHILFTPYEICLSLDKIFKEKPQ